MNDVNSGRNKLSIQLELARIFFSQQELMKRVLVVCSLVVLLVVLVYGKSYTVGGQILVWSKKIQQGISGEIVGGTGASYIPASLTDIETENNIIRSPAILKKAVTSLYYDGLMLPEYSFMDTWVKLPIRNYLVDPIKRLLGAEQVDVETAEIDGLIKEASGLLEVAAFPGSNVINVSCESDDPQRCVYLVNTLMESYMDTRRELIVNEGMIEFFSQKKQLYANRLKELEQEKAELFSDYGVTNVQEELSIALQAANRETAELNQLMDQQLESNAWLVYLHEQLTQMRETDATRISFPFSFGGSSSNSAFMDTEMREQITRISTLQSEYAAARSAFRSDSARVRTLVNQLNEQKIRLIMLVHNRITEREEAAKVLQTLIENKRFRLDGFQERTKELKQVAMLESGISTELLAVNDAYFKYSQQFEEKRTENIGKVDDYASVRILSQSEMPLEPSSPKRVIVLILGLAASVFIALTVGLLADLTSNRLRDETQLSQVLESPVLMVLDDQEPHQNSIAFSLKPREFWKWLTS